MRYEGVTQRKEFEMITELQALKALARIQFSFATRSNDAMANFMASIGKLSELLSISELEGFVGTLTPATEGN